MEPLSLGSFISASLSILLETNEVMCVRETEGEKRKTASLFLLHNPVLISSLLFSIALVFYFPKSLEKLLSSLWSINSLTSLSISCCLNKIFLEIREEVFPAMIRFYPSPQTA